MGICQLVLQSSSQRLLFRELASPYLSEPVPKQALTARLLAATDMSEG